ELPPEGGDMILRARQGADPAVLDDRRPVAGGVEERLFRASSRDAVLCGDVTQSKSRHRVRLAEREKRDGALVHAGQRRRADMLRAVEKNVLVRFVRQEPELALAAYAGDGLDVLARQDAAGRVVRRVDVNGAGLGGDRGSELL